MNEETLEEKDRQIELIAQYHEVFDNPQDSRRIRALLIERDQLLKIIEDAGHAVHCASLRTRVEAPDSADPRVVFCSCNCFKSKVTE